MKNKHCILFIFLSIILLNSCLKKQDLESVDYGAAINNDSLQNKMSDSIGELSYDNIKKKEINIFTARSSLQEGAFRDRYKQELFVSDVVQDPKQTTIDFIFNRTDFINPQNSIGNTGYRIVVTKEATSGANSNSNNISLKSFLKDNVGVKAAAEDTPKPLFLFRAYAYFAIQACREPQVTCHNLKTTVRKVYLKPEQANTTVCPDINNCLIDENKVEFDLLDASVKTDDGKPYRTHYTFVVSPQLPFLSKVIQYCARGLTKYQDRMVLVEDCSSLDDFSYGQ